MDCHFDSAPVPSEPCAPPISCTCPSTPSRQNVCAICLERYRQGRGQALFTAECGHVFHFHCITANVRYGHVACPLCRVAWKEVPWAAPQGRHLALPHNATGTWAGPMTNRTLASSPLAPNLAPSGAEEALRPSGFPGSGTTFRGSRGNFGGSFQDQPHMRGRHGQLDQTVVDGVFSGPSEPLTPPPPEPSVHNDDEKVDMPIAGSAPEIPSWQELKLNVCAEGTAAPYQEVRACYTVLVTVRAPPQHPPLEEVMEGRGLSFTAPDGACGTPGGNADMASLGSVVEDVEVGGDAEAYRDRVPIDLVAALDMSGSMGGAKLKLVQEAMEFVIQMLGPRDRISIVAFSTQAWRVMGLKRMTPAGKEAAVTAVDSLLPRGGTNIADGLLKSIRILEERSTRNAVAAIMLLSDGQDTTAATSYGFTSR